MGMSGNRMPTALETTYRIQRNIISKICEDEDFNIFDLKEPLKIEPLLQEKIKPIKFDMDRKIKLCEEEGLIYCSGFVAKKMKKINDSLGSFQNKPSPDQVSSKFLDEYSRGFMTYPSETWLGDMRIMREMFMEQHPKNSLQKGRGVTTNFFLLLVHHFPQYDKRILHLVTRMFTRFRLRWMNKLAKKKKNKGKKHAMSLRGAKNFANLTCS